MAEVSPLELRRRVIFRELRNIHQFNAYRVDSLRLIPGLTQKASMEDLWRNYRYWKELYGGPGRKFVKKEFEELLQIEYGAPVEGGYSLLILAYQ